MNEITDEIRRGAKRAAEPRTVAQLPAYRDASNILYFLTQLTAKTPRKLTRFSDRILSDASELLKCISLANEFRGEQRAYYLTLALANVSVIKTYVVSLQKLGIISNKQVDRLKTLLKGLTAQIVAWREFTKSLGSGI